MIGPAVRRATPADDRALADVERSAFDHPWSEADLAAQLAHPDGRTWLAVLDAGGQPAAYAAVRRLDGRDAELLRIATRPAARRRGLGSALLEAAFGALRREGIANLHLEVAAGNAAALGLYAAHGFAPAGRRRGYYRDGQDAVLLVARLG